jgi:uncharacterized protein
MSPESCRRRESGRVALFVGGASSLEVAPGTALADLPDFPEAYKAEAREGREALAVWRTEADGLDWTYLSPALAPGLHRFHEVSSGGAFE